ncbi:Acyl-[acyl-carrier-protein]--UDP-N-acetylglucosamine O-acyltransferase [hydrothermal vent metagenome]|uniref:Acyl-[acyl-carrier-protein]--UDP-N-acetylglucosamine O-acyltransferase n=1 Tax=hydrothermal vent metagenome TaxID=652676 RepID=A0A3B1B296_9ZZZZ
MNIHPTAIIEDGTQLHPSVQVGPYSIIETGAVIGEGCIIESNVRIYSATRMGSHNRACHGVTLGSEPQDLSYTPDQSKPLTIGDHNHFKEGVNISRGAKTDHGTIVGNHNYMMTNAHIGHDCIVGDHNVFANTAMIAGHVEMEHHIFLSGHIAIHQFCRVGAYSMVGGISGVVKDIPPYVIADGHRAQIIGLNIVGLRRNGFNPQQRNLIKRAYKTIYKTGLKPSEALAKLKADNPPEEVQLIIRFFEAAKRGIISHR